MHKGILFRIMEIISAQKLKKRWQKVVFTLSAMVVFCTVYALILPAITLERQTICGIEDHEHVEICYAKNAPDISDGPAVSVCAEESDGEVLADPPPVDEPVAETPPVSDSAADPIEEAAPIEESAPIEEDPAPIDDSASPLAEIPDISDYVERNGGRFSIILHNKDNTPLEKDENNNFIVFPNTEYVLNLQMDAPKGILPGQYKYQLPDGLSVLGGAGALIDDKTKVELGTWTIDSNGLILFDFNQNANTHTGLKLTAVMGIYFKDTDSIIDFDGKIIVKIENPNEEEPYVAMNKWGSQGDGSEAKPDRTKIYWTVQIIADENATLAGKTVGDTPLTEGLSFSDEDIANGLSFGVTEKDPITGEQRHWHSWVVYPGDPNLTWNETSWSYTFPEKVTCKYCGEINVHDNVWDLLINYTATPDFSGAIGNKSYENHVVMEDLYTYGWASFTNGEMTADVVKDGVFQGGADGGKFRWTVRAAIPGISEGQKGSFGWYLLDEMSIRDANNQIGYIHNDMNNARVTAVYQGVTYNVPFLHDASSATGPFAWCILWSPNHDGIDYGREVRLSSRCECNETNCQHWKDGHCCLPAYDENWVAVPGYCYCWTLKDDTVFTFEYETDHPDLIAEYGGSGNVLRNNVLFYQQVLDDNGNKTPVEADSDHVNVTIPGLFKKELTKDYKDYTANYTITVNESKISLVDSGPLTIHDEMTDTLAFIQGSLVIIAEDLDGNRKVLTLDEDYSIEYDGSGTETDSAGKPVHVLDIKIFEPESAMYILNYDATLIFPDDVSQGVKYSNSASISLFGSTFSDSSVEKIYADINISAKKHQVTIVKTEEDSNEKLADAEFGLFNQNGGLITKGKTDEKGTLVFSTDLQNGIILLEHVPYYVQELDAPPGYRRNSTKYWLAFCSDAVVGGTGGTTHHIDIGEEAARDPHIGNMVVMPNAEVVVLNIENATSKYELPVTGGPGTKMLMIGGTLLIIISALLLCYKYTRGRRFNDPSAR